VLNISKQNLCLILQTNLYKILQTNKCKLQTNQWWYCCKQINCKHLNIIFRHFCTNFGVQNKSGFRFIKYLALFTFKTWKQLFAPIIFSLLGMPELMATYVAMIYYRNDIITNFGEYSLKILSKTVHKLQIGSCWQSQIDFTKKTVKRCFPQNLWKHSKIKNWPTMWL